MPSLEISSRAKVLGVVVLTGMIVGAGGASGRTPAYRRIVAIGPNSAEVICALGACDAIVGISKFCVHPPEVLDRPKVGGLFDPDLERIIALRPDLLVLRGYHSGLEALARRTGIQLFHDRTDTLDDVVRNVEALGELLGKTGEAEEIVRAYRSGLEAVKRRVEGRPRPRVLLTVSRQPDRLANILTCGRGSFLHEMIEVAGGENLFGHVDMAYPQVSTESIVLRRPEVIIELMPEVEDKGDLRSSMIEVWRSAGPTPAMSAGRLHVLTDENALIPSPRYVEFIDKVSHLLHPDSAGE